MDESPTLVDDRCLAWFSKFSGSLDYRKQVVSAVPLRKPGGCVCLDRVGMRPTFSQSMSEGSLTLNQRMRRIPVTFTPPSAASDGISCPFLFLRANRNSHLIGMFSYWSFSGGCVFTLRGRLADPLNLTQCNCPSPRSSGEAMFPDRVLKEPGSDEAHRNIISV